MNKNNWILITGANGEVGHGLIKQLGKTTKIIATDLNDLDPRLAPFVNAFIKGDITDNSLLNTFFEKFEINTVFHLAALLSTSGEKNPFLAHKVNVEGTIGILESVQKHCEKMNESVRFIFPSSIAVYGISDLNTKRLVGKVSEDRYQNPITMYGINKLYCEHLGVYYSSNYKLLANEHSSLIDFRCVRFPGLISAETMPSGGTSDYASEILHFAADNKPYECFVRPDSRIPFMVMPDAIRSLLMLIDVPKNKLTHHIYNIGGFSASAQEITQLVKKSFPEAKISYKIHNKRQKIIDSWPEDVDDSRAKKDWHWKIDYDFNKAFNDYLIPAIKRRYNST